MNEYYIINPIFEENQQLRMQLHTVLRQTLPLKEENDKLTRQMAVLFEHTIKPVLSENERLKKEIEELRKSKIRKMKGRK